MSPSASYSASSRIQRPPTSAGITCSATMTALFLSSTLSWFSGARRHSLSKARALASGIGSAGFSNPAGLPSPTAICVIFQGMPRASALACFAAPTVVRIA
ncbi:hypothetical protein D3C77_335710 [compost metagenome]